MKAIQKIRSGLCPTLTVLAASLLAACGGGGDGSGSFAFLPPAAGSGNVTVSGVLSASAFKPGSATDPVVVAGYYQGATVCVDANNNGRCDSGETAAVTDANGKFSLSLSAASALIADIGTSAKNTASNAKVSAREVLRVTADQVKEQGTNVVVSPLSSEVARLIEANGSTYATEKANLATRLGVTAAAVLGDANAATGATQIALLNEANALNNRFAYATLKLDRQDLFPDALANPGGDPRLATQAGVTKATVTVAADTRKPITFLQSQQAAFNVEGIPRYDNIFIVMLENKASSSIVNSPSAPKINGYLKAGNQLVSYYATGYPSEPNYTALGGADDWGINDDAQWNCGATDPANAVQDTPEPDSKVQPSSPFQAGPTNSTCGASGTNHNIVGRPNLFNAITSAGLTWRTYSESMNPGQDFRIDSVVDTAITAQDHVYAPGAAGPNPTQLGDATLKLPMPAGLYKTKHHPGMAYQNVRSAPEWAYSNRTLGGGQWDANLKSGVAYPIPATYDVDQFGSDLASGNVGNLNFLMPDQCDDMHGISVKGPNGVGTASDCGSVANNVSSTALAPIITRGDNYVDYTVKRIQASPLWNNPQKRVAIVLMFDEGNSTVGFNACCGWNVANSTVANPLKQNSDGTWSVDGSIKGYSTGNRGHGESIFGILTNQSGAPKGISDSDAYSHFSFVRTLQDMFQLADPAVDASYMNRSKYTETFIAQNILNLPEYTSSADTHFDSVRPINHSFVVPASYTQKQSADAALPAQTGPDANQVNVWSLK